MILMPNRCTASIRSSPRSGWRHRDQLSIGRVYRFVGSRGGRKIHYARVLAETLDVGRTPEPLDRLPAFA